PLHQRAVGYYRYIGAFSHNPGFSERYHEIASRVAALVVGLAIQMLVLEKQHRIVRSYCSAEKAIRVERSGRHHNSPSGNGAEQRNPRLAMVNGAAAQVAPYGCPYYHWALPDVVRPPPQHWDFVVHLHVCGPNVVEELDLGNRLQAAGRHPHSPSNYRCFRDWRIEHTGAAKLPLKVSGDLEDASLPFQPAQVFTPGNIGDVFAEPDNSRV